MGSAGQEAGSSHTSTSGNPGGHRYSRGRGTMSGHLSLGILLQNSATGWGEKLDKEKGLSMEETAHFRVDEKNLEDEKNKTTR